MGVRKTFGFSEIKKKYGNGKMEVSIDSQVLRQLSYIGEQVCEHARNITPTRNSGGFDDQTGNLRSSIGYAIFKNGERKKKGGFKQVKDTAKDGLKQSKEAVDQYGSAIASTNGWTLVIVAGMNYAKYVEAKGHNVLRLSKYALEAKIEELKAKL